MSINTEIITGSTLPLGWSKRKGVIVLMSTMLVAGGLSGGIAISLAATVAQVALAALGTALIVGICSGYFVRKQIKLYSNQPFIIPLPSMAEQANKLFNHLFDQKSSSFKNYPDMSHALAAQFLGCSFISDASLGNEKLEGSTCSTIFNFIKYCLNLDAPSQATMPLLTAIEQVLEIDARMQECKANTPNVYEARNEFARWITLKIKNLPVNEPLLIPGGWIGEPGHFMLYEVIKQENGQYTMNVYNSGAGLRRHPVAPYIGRKLKYLPYIYQRNIDESALCHAFIWRAYFQYLHIKPISSEECPLVPYSEKDIYDSFLKCIHPFFGEEAHRYAKLLFDPNDYMTPQRAGTCSADAFFAYLHARTKRNDIGKKNYKILKKAITFQALVNYIHFLSAKEIFAHQKELSPILINERLGILQFFRTALEKYARGVRKSIKKGWLTSKQGEITKKLIESVMQIVSTSELSYNSKYRLSAPELDPTLKEHTPTVLQIMEETAPSLFEFNDHIDEDPGLTDLSFTTPSPKELSNYLSDVLKSFESLSSKNKYFNNVSKTIDLKNILFNLPSPNEDYWDHVPSDIVNDCLFCLKEFSKTFKNSSLNYSNTYAVCVQKIVALAKRLSENLSDEPMIQKIILDTSYLTHTMEGFSRNGYSCLTDAQADDELNEIIIFFSKREDPKRTSTFFGKDDVKISKEELQDFIINGTNEWQTNEILFVCRYLQEHPQVIETIKSKHPYLRDSFEDMLYNALCYNISFQVGYEKEFLPKAYYFLAEIAESTKVYLHGRINYLVTKDKSFQISRFFSSANHPFLAHYSDGVTKPLIWRDKRYSFPIADSPHTVDAIFSIGLDNRTHNHIMIKEIQNDNTILHKIPHELALVGSTDDKSHQILKALSYFKQNFHAFKHSRDMQVTFSCLLFEFGWLREQLRADESSAEILLNHIKAFYERSRQTGDVANGAFFLRMGSYLLNYFKKYKISQAVMAQFPDFLKELDQWFREPGLLDSERSILAREYLGIVYRLKLDNCDLSLVLNKAFFLANHPLPDNNPYAFAPELKRDIYELLFFDLPKRLEESGDQLDTILNRAVNPAKPLKEKWKKSPAGYCSSDLHYQINLREGTLYIRGVASSVLPDWSIWDATFKKLYVGPVSEVATRENCSYFKDSFNFQNRVKYSPHLFLVFQKNIDGVWHTHYYAPINNFVHKAQTWQVPQTKEIIFLDQGKMVYRYDHKESCIICCDNGPRHGLILDSYKEESAIHTFFKAFDDKAQFWKDTPNHIKLIELPTYQLMFIIDKNHDIYPMDKQDFRRAKYQIPSLCRLPGYIVLENEKNEKEVLIPRKSFQVNTNFIDKLQYQANELDEEPLYYTYRIDSKGNLSSDELAPRLFLVYLYLVQRNNGAYEKAFRILKHKGTKLSAYSEEEQGILKLICASHQTTFDQDARACSIRLKAEALLLQNSKDFGTSPVPSGIWKSFNNHAHIDDLERYASLRTHAPRFLLSETETDLFRYTPYTYYPSVQDEDRYSEVGEYSDIRWSKIRLTKMFDFTAKVDKEWNLTRPEDFFKQFPFLYFIARNQPKGSSERKKLEIFLKLIHRQPKIHHLLSILRAVLAEPSVFPKVEEIQDFLKPDIGTKYLHGDLFEELSDITRILQGSTTIVGKKLLITKERLNFKILGNIFKHQIKVAAGLFHTHAEEPLSIRFSEESVQSEIVKKFPLLSWSAHDALETPPLLLNIDNIKIWQSKADILQSKEEKLKKDLQALSKDKAGQSFNLYELSLKKLVVFRELACLEEIRLSLSQECEFFVMAKENVEHERIFKCQSEIVNQLEQRAFNSKTALEKRTAEKLLKSLEHYRKHTKFSSNFIISKDDVPRLKNYLKNRFRLIQAVQKKLKSEILAFANQLPLDPVERQDRVLELLGDPGKKITLEDLQFLYVGRNPNAFKKLNPCLNEENSKLLCQMMEDFLLRGIKKNQLSRALKEIENLEILMNDEADDHPSVLQKMQDVYETLTAENVYDPKKNPEFSVLQFKANITLYQKQIDNIQKLMSKDRNVVLQMIMGAGKTAIMSVILALLQAMEESSKDDENLLSILILPTSLMDEISKLVKTRAREFFLQESYAIDWGNTSLDNLKNITEKLELIRTERSLLLLKDRDLPNFFLQARLHRLHCTQQEKLGKEDIQKLEEFRKIKTIFKNYGNALFDEIDFILNCRDEIHIALGIAKPISPTYNEITEFLYITLLNDPEISNRIYFDFSISHSSSAIPYTPDLFQPLQAMLIEKSLHKLKSLYSEKDLEQIKVYLHYQSKEDDTNFPSLPKTFTKQQKNDLAFLRNELHVVLKHTIDTIHGQHYGIFPQRKIDKSSAQQRIAGPFEGVIRPKYGSKFSRHEEQQNKTRQSYAKTGIPSSLIHTELQRIKAAIEDEYQEHDLESPKETDSYKEFLALCGEELAGKYQVLLLDRVGMGEVIRELFEYYNHSPDRIQKFVSRYIIPHITFYDKQISSTAQHLPNFFKKAKGFAGTMLGKNTRHPRFTTEIDEAIDGEIITALARDGANELICFDVKEPVALIRQVMSCKETNRCLAIIDQGGLFKEIGNDILARMILVLRKDLQAVVFFEEEKLMILKREFAKALPFNSQNDVSPYLRLTIYDQPHCRGIHIEQHLNALAVVTENKNGIFASDEQAVFRMRKLVKHQRVKYVIPEDLNRILQNYSKKPNTTDLAFYLQLNQDLNEQDDNLMAVRQQMDLQVFNICDAVLDQVPCQKLNQKKYQELEEILITKVKDEPFEEYGTLGALASSKIVLQSDRDRLLSGIMQWQKKYGVICNVKKLKEDMDALIKHMIDNNFVAEKLPTMSDFGKFVSVKTVEQVQQQVNANVKQNLLQEIVNQRKDRVKNDVSKEMNPKRIAQEISYKGMFLEKDFFRPLKWKGSINSAIKQASPHNPCWIPLKDLLKEQDEANVIESLLGHLPFFVPIDLAFVENNLSKENKPFGNFQKPLGFCLLVKENKKLSFYPLDGRNVELCKHALKKSKEKKMFYSRKLCLYHPDHGIYQQGNMRVDKDEFMKDPHFVSLNACFKFLCGRVTGYTKIERKILKEWLASQSNLKGVIEFFYRVLLRNKKDKQNFESSPLGTLFKDLLKED